MRRMVALCALSLALGCGATPAPSTSHPDRGPSPEPGKPSVAATAPVVPAAASSEVSQCGAFQLSPEPAGVPVQPGPLDPPRVPIVRPEALDGFFQAWAGLARGTAKDHVRIAVFGDSNLTMDFPTGRLRRRLQRWFGDGGHGFVSMGRPWSHYRHMDVLHNPKDGWISYAITTKPLGDGLYGLAGIVAENESGGVSTWVETAPKGSLVGTQASQFELFFIRKERGGSVDLVLDGKTVGHVDTRGKPGLGFERVTAQDGPHRFEVVSGKGISRIAGVALERDVPGFVIDTFGVGSMNTKSLGRHDAEVFKAMMAERKYDLVVFQTGANDITTMDSVPETMHKVLGWCRAALPRASFLMLTPPDRGLRKPLVHTQRVAEQRREVSKTENTALWDQFEAMGGAGSMARYVRSGFAIEDAIHFNEKGAAFVADRELDALLEAFRSFLARHPAAGCGEH